MKLTAKKLRELLHYNPKTGVFTWRVRQAHRNKIGDVAGYHSDSSGYVYIRIKSILYRAHRLAFLYMTGSWPTLNLDHKNGVRHDNSWHNLREATQSQNNYNRRRANKNNKLGIRGIRRNGNFYEVRIGPRGKCYHGIFKTIEEAKVKAREVYATICGEFGRCD